MCPDRSILSAYFDGEVDNQWSGEIADHLENCEMCSSYISELKGQSEILQSLPSPNFEDSLDRVKSRIREKRTLNSSLRFWEKRISLPAAAAAAVIAASITLGFNMINTDKNDRILMANIAEENFSSEVIDLPGNKIDEIFSMMESSLSDEFSSNSIVSLPADVNLVFNGDSQLIRSAGFIGSGAP